MKTKFASATLLSLLLLAAGCRVDERIVWAPDGSRAAAQLGSTLHLMEPDGALSPAVSSNVTAVAWLRDGRGLVVVRQRALTSWDEAAALLPPDEVEVVAALAKGMPDLIKAALAAAGGDAKAIEPKFIEALHIDEFPETVPAAIHLVQDRQPDLLKQAVQGSTDPAQFLADLGSVCTTRVSELCVIPLEGGHPAGVERVLASSLTPLLQPRVSPTASVVAFRRGDALLAIPLTGGTGAVLIAEGAVGEFAWSPDGRALVYAVRVAGKWESGAVNLARIEQRIAVDAGGAPAAGDARPLAINGSTYEPRVCCLPDGRVLFSGVAAVLPAAGSGVRTTRFYLIDPTSAETSPPVAVPAAEDALPQDLAAFAPSPDGRRVAVVESGSDVVAVLELATGAVEILSPKQSWQSRVLPAWRNADELYFAALPKADGDRPALLRWRKGEAPQAVSASWAEAAAASLLEKPRSNAP